ncbi:hypothetical protein PTSG_02932 [Salpingoeca rosetta]|uniref:Uncharacterized protein n=1 Tax=Salpingoeca rosetta (strain ATCC 50818 / BSB-021) TaxID=946362 RepID=F2U3R8_SALR5|nr:uncharacterized protein PTSG_02932 [Salpingoeca rosetta]EGD82262.1 hypothetical protein PTSG_02932 [Salpingoeca rosetta]|eukprot:XP_004996445.1 hypothetical protein PTSG_02932 [Salpingoeca rosetta]
MALLLHQDSLLNDMWLVCPGQCGHRMRQQCVGPTVIKTTLMIEHKAVAVEHLAEVSPDELPDILRAHLRRGNRRLPASANTLLPTLFGNHRPTPAQQQLLTPLTTPTPSSSPAPIIASIGKVGYKGPRGNAYTSKRHDVPQHKAMLRALPGVQMVQIDGASGLVEVKHETYGKWSEIRFCPITFIVCTTVFLRRVHHHGRVWPDFWDARMIDGMSRRITPSSCCLAWSPSFPGWPFSRLRGAVHHPPPTSTLTCGGGGGDLFFETGILPLHLCVARAVHRTPRQRQHLQPAEGRYSQGNRVEERIDTELVQRGDNMKVHGGWRQSACGFDGRVLGGAGEMDEAMITGRINTRLVSKGVDDIVI